MHTQPGESEEVRRLFHEHVPELASGLIEIKAIVRKRGQRVMVAVHSSDSRVDPVGSCVGLRGIRMKAVVQQLSGEKIDIIRWSESIEDFIRNALAPAQVERIVLDAAAHRATVHAKSEYVSLIDGRQGMRRKLVSKLTGWDIQAVET